MTLVEVMTAMVILLVGVLGVLSTLDTANAVTSENLARDGATGLAREQLERARGLPYADLANSTTIASALSSGLADSDASVVATFTSRRRGVTYRTTIESCVLDDPSDGIGGATGTPCKPLPPTSGGGGPPVNVPGSGSSVLGLNVLGIQLAGAGDVVDIVCSLVGRDSILDSLIGQGRSLNALVSSGSDAGVCTSGGKVAVDRQANDATAVTTTVEWTVPRSGRVVQRAVVSGPREVLTP